MLWRLLESFREDYFLVYFDIEHNLDTAQANQVDLLYLLGSTIFQVAVAEGLEPDRRLLEELSESVYSLTESRKETPKNESVDVIKLVSGLICFGAGALGGGVAEKTAQKLTKAFAELSPGNPVSSTSFRWPCSTSNETTSTPPRTRSHKLSSRAVCVR